MQNGEYAIVDNAGYVETGIKNLPKAVTAVKNLRKDKNYEHKGNVAIVKVVGTYDSFLTGNDEYLGADGKPKAD